MLSAYLELTCVAKLLCERKVRLVFGWYTIWVFNFKVSWIFMLAHLLYLIDDTFWVLKEVCVQ